MINGPHPRIKFTNNKIALKAIFWYNTSMITYFQAFIMGLLQGVSELFPISSLGHSVIFPSLFGWNLNQNDPYFLNFLVATHFATACVLFLFFWKEWLNIIKGLGRSLVQRQIQASDVYARLGWLLVVGTIPAGILGLLFQDQIKNLLATPKIAAIFLALNGLLLYGAELLRRKAPTDKHDDNSDIRVSKLSWRQAFIVGLSQVLALIPGLSRSGSTMGGGLLVGLSNEDAARFSFLLATPIIGAAALLKLPDLFNPAYRNVLGPSVAGAIAAALAAYFAVKFLLKFFHTNKLTPFAIYCVCAGVMFSIIFYLR